MNKVTALYARVARADGVHSIEEQKAKLYSYAAGLRNWHNIKVYADEGYSGNNLNRPALEALIADIESKEVERVVVLKLDRLSRSHQDVFYLVENVFEANDVDFISVTEGYETRSTYGKVMTGILSAFSQLEKNNAELDR